MAATTAPARYTLVLADGTEKTYARKIDALKAAGDAPRRLVSPAGNVLTDTLPVAAPAATPAEIEAAGVRYFGDGHDPLTDDDVHYLRHQIALDKANGTAGYLTPDPQPAADAPVITSKRGRSVPRKTGDPRADRGDDTATAKATRAPRPRKDGKVRVSRDAHFVDDAGRDVRTLPGVVRVRRSQATRALVASVNAEAFGIDATDGKWAAVCLTHGTIVNTKQRRTASYSLPHPESFCGGCRRAMDDADAATTA